MTRMQRLAKLLADIEAMIAREMPMMDKPAPGSPDNSDTGVPAPTPSPDEAQSGTNPKGGYVPPAPPPEEPPVKQG